MQIRWHAGAGALLVLATLGIFGCSKSEESRLREAMEKRAAEEDRARKEAQSFQPEARKSVDLVLIEAGPFKMGDNSFGGLPERQVTLPAYFIGRKEVSNADYAKFVKATDSVPPFNWDGFEPPADRLDHTQTRLTGERVLPRSTPPPTPSGWDAGCRRRKSGRRRLAARTGGDFPGAIASRRPSATARRPGSETPFLWGPTRREPAPTAA